MQRQQTLIDAITEEPFCGYMFHGDAGTGKTSLMKYQWELVRYVKNVGSSFLAADEWQRQITDFACNRRTYAIDAEFIRSSGLSIRCLFLDDVDKLKDSDFCTKEFWALLNAIVEARKDGKNLFLTMSSNLNPTQFRERFGDAIYRRASELCKWASLTR